jgi:hypothetical protein
LISQLELRRKISALPAFLPQTTQLEQAIKIGTGFHEKWYRSQKEHWLGWLGFQECQCLLKDQQLSNAPAEPIWNRLKCSPAMFWLAEGLGVRQSLLEEAKAQALSASLLNSKDGSPHGTFMRSALPWPTIDAHFDQSQSLLSVSQANNAVNVAFFRLTQKKSLYRRAAKEAGYVFPANIEVAQQ